MTDPSRLHLFLKGEIDPGTFRHADHVWVGFELLRRHDFPAAACRLSKGLKAIASRAGKPGAYHETLSLAFLSLIAERRALGADEGFEAFVQANADLMDKGALARCYAPGRLDPDGVPSGTPANQKVLAIGPVDGGDGVAVIDFGALKLDSISFYWGSIDNWNSVQLLTPTGGALTQPGASISGASLIIATCLTDPTGPQVACGQGVGNHAGSQLVTISWDPKTDDVCEMRFTDSTHDDFEVADVTGTSALPEPAAWSLMMLGLAATGAGLRRRRTMVAS